MDFLSLALRSFDLDGNGPRLHAIAMAAREANLRGGGSPSHGRDAMRRPWRCGPPSATVVPDESWLGAEAMVDPACAAVLRGAARDVATAADPEWMPI